jgi:transcriptional regulator with XRE-family HTH domain
MSPRRKLAEARNARGLTQHVLAAALGTTQTMVSRWESGSVYPSAYYRKKLCSFFGKSLSELELDRIDAVDRQGIHCIPDEDLIGRKQELLHLRQFLAQKQAFVAVCGLPGVGKTALVATLARDPYICKQFPDGVLWTGLGVNPPKSALHFWGKQLGMTEEEMSDLHTSTEWGAALHHAIGSRRMLLIIDDAWKEEAALAFKVGGPNCAHIVTTRVSALANTLTSQVLTVHELDEEHSLFLLHTLAPDCVEHMLDEARTLVTAVGGLPLALKLVGNHLRIEGRNGQTRRIVAAFERLADRAKRLQLTQTYAPLEYHPSLENEGSVSLQSIIAVSDQHLSPQARVAFYTLGALPEKPATFSEGAALAVASCSSDVLDEITDAGLLEFSGTERYSLHQIIADYVRLQLQAQSREVQGEIYRRLIDYAISTACASQNDLDLLAREYPMYRRALDKADAWGYHSQFVHLATALATYIRERMVTAQIYLTRAEELAQKMGSIQKTKTLLEGNASGQPRHSPQPIPS